jgi:hypothetical protein
MSKMRITSSCHGREQRHLRLTSLSLLFKMLRKIVTDFNYAPEIESSSPEGFLVRV